MTDKITIPQKHIDFCKAVAKLAAEAEYNSLNLTFNPGYEDDWNSQIQMRWAFGRHGEDAQRVFVSSTLNVHAEAV